MKTKLLQIAVSIYIGAALLMLLPACGKSSDPISQYSVKGGPVTDAPSENQTKAMPEIFIIDVGSMNLGRSASFVEGFEGQVLIKITPKTDKVTNFTISLLDFPLQETPKIQNTSTPNVFVLMWKPPMGTIPPGGTQAEIQTRLLVRVTEASDARLIGMADSPVIHLFVGQNHAQPKILNYTSLEKGVDEGSKVPFIIDIEDPGSITGNLIPEIQITSFRHSNTEAFVADGSFMVNPDLGKSVNIENLGQGKWRFHYILNAERFEDNRDRKGKLDPSASTVPVCFYIRAVSVRKTLSVQPQVCFVGRFAAQAPILTWEDQTLTELKTGIEHQIKFSIKSSNGLGKTEINDVNKQISGLPGTKVLLCENQSTENPNVQNCILSWTPTCSRTNSTKKLTLKVENKLNEKIKTQVFEKEFVLLANEELCPAKNTQPKTKGVVK